MFTASYGFIRLPNPFSCTLTSTPSWGQFVAVIGPLGLTSRNFTFSGSGTGQRYNASRNGVIDTGGGGASYFPGNSAGATATGAQYV